MDIDCPGGAFWKIRPGRAGTPVENRTQYVTKPYKFIGFGAMDVTKPYKFIGFGAMDVTKPYKFIAPPMLTLLELGEKTYTFVRDL
jgi:hypothetical protein